MRFAVLISTMLLVGCLSTQPAHNPLKREKADASPVKAAPNDVKKPRPVPRDPKSLEKLDLMKEMYLLQSALNEDILKMCGSLTPLELAEFDAWLSQFSVRLHKFRKRIPHPKKKKDRRVF